MAASSTRRRGACFKATLSGALAGLNCGAGTAGAIKTSLRPFNSVARARKASQWPACGSRNTPPWTEPPYHIRPLAPWISAM